QPATDDLILQVYRRYHDPNFGGAAEGMHWHFLFQATNNQACWPGTNPGTNLNTVCNQDLTNGVNFAVQPGDEFYFNVSAPLTDQTAGNQRNAVYWAPRISY